MYLINITSVALKKDLPIHTNYSVIYTKERQNEKEANCLAGYNVNINIFIKLIRGFIQ